VIEYFAFKNLQVNTKTRPFTLVKLKSPKKNSPLQAATDSSLEMMSSPVSPHKSSDQPNPKKRARKPKSNYQNPEEPALVPTVPQVR